MTNHVATYPPDEQLETWKAEADEMDMSLSEYVQSMAEAGRKDFAISVAPDETVAELRDQRADLRDELERTRNRVNRLEQMLHSGERGAIIEYVRENPGATTTEIMNHLNETAGKRRMDVLEALETEELRREDGAYYEARS